GLLLSRSPESDHGILWNDRHLDPTLLVVGRARIRHGQVIIGRDDAADLVERVSPGLASEHVVLPHVLVHPGVGHQTESPQASNAARPSGVSRDADHGGFHRTSSLTSMTPGSRKSRSWMSSTIMSLAGQPMAVKVSCRRTFPSATSTP